MQNLEVITHSAIKIKGDYVIYVDPYNINKESHDADYIFCTHSHYDHFSKQDILKVKKDSTYYIVTQDLLNDVKDLALDENHITVVAPNKEYIVNGLAFKTVRAYNQNKEFHKKENNWVGYVINVNSCIYYIAGDTDFLDELKSIKCDVALLPVGGHFTMNAKEAATLANCIMPKYAIPTHYGSVVGTKQDAKTFVSLLDKNIKGEILIS